MSPERWRRVEDLYHAVLNQAADRKEAFLLEQSEGDTEIREEVKSLLAQQTRGDRMFDVPAWQQAASMLADEVAPAALRLKEGVHLGPYRILGLLGAGGMGEVYRAKDTRLGREVALKLLPQECLENPERQSRFLREARMASSLNHPSIMTFYDLGLASGQPFLVLEYVAGKTLDRVVPRRGLPLSEGLALAIQIADALAAAHAAGVVHRDLKPANIMVSEKGAVKLLDFGLAKLVQPETEHTPGSTKPVTISGMVVGTVAYMSPEQAQDKPVDARSDIFSFGCILYEMFTGRHPFQGDSPASTTSAILRDEPKPPTELRRDLLRDLERIVLRCLRKDPNRRFQHADDLKVALMEVYEEAQATPASVELAAPKPRALRSIAAGVAGVVLCTAGWFVIRILSRTESPPAISPFTSYPGYERNPALSPDGNQVAFEWDGDRRNNSDIYVKLIGSDEPLRLTTNAARDHSPAWSPDGRWIAFFRELPAERAAVLIVPALGGVERKLTETASSSIGGSSLDFRGLTWTPDGKSLVAPDQEAQGTPLGLYLLSLDTGEKRRLTSPPPPLFGDVSPAFSPDGRFLAFSRSFSVQSSDIYLLPLTADLRANGDPRPLTHDRRWNDGPTWLDDGQEILFSSNRDGSQSLWRMLINGGAPPRRLSLPGENLSFPTVSRQTRRAVYVKRFLNADIWRMNLSNEAGRPGTSELLISSSGLNSNGSYSPDGQRITFQSDRSGRFEIWVCDSDGSHARQLTFVSRGHAGTPRWSPDGKWIAFDSNAEGQYQIFVISSEGGKPTRLTTLQKQSIIPSWSRDSKSVYFSSEGRGRYEIWKVPVSGGSVDQVTTQGGLVSAESSDGRRLYYLKDLVGAIPSGPLWERSVEGGAEHQVLNAVLLRDFAVSERGIYYARLDHPSGWSIRLFDFATGRDSVIGQYTKPPNLGLSFAPDRGQLIYTQNDQEGSDLMLVENFH